MTEQRKKMQLVYQRRYRQKLYERGLTARRTPRRNAIHKIGPEMTETQKDTIRHKNVRHSKYLNGLTRSGAPRIRNQRGDWPTRLEIEWREFRKTMEIPITKSWSDWIPLHGEERAA